MHESKASKNPLNNLLWIISVVATSLILSIIKNLAPHQYIASWDIVSYLLLLLPLIYLIYIKEIANPFTKWIIPFIIILIYDVFYYNNDLVVDFLPLVIYGMIAMLYLGSMQSMEYLFQVFIPKINYSAKIFTIIGMLIKPVLSLKKYQQELFKNALYMRIALALLITLPVMGLFLTLFMASDPNFSHFIENLFSFSNPFKAYHAFTVPIVFFFFLLLFGYSISNTNHRKITFDTDPFDRVIIGIFLASLNFLFISFLLFQLAYIFGGESYLNNTGINISYYAREGFFQLATVMSIVIFIFLIIIYRYKNEKLIAIMMSGLMLQTMVIGYASLKKMYLYQSLKGATVLRYYVEWFDYLLLVFLLLGIIYLFIKRPFYYMLNLIVILGLISFTTVASLNIDGIVAKQNIAQFTNKPKKLDKELISNLSIDALPYIQQTDIKIKIFHKNQRNCNKFNNYHLGYCEKIAKYGENKIEFIDFRSKYEKGQR